MRPASIPASRLLLALAVSAAALTGCGGSSHTLATSADPASAIPASAALYAGATVRPQGAQSTEALAAGAALTGQANPYLRLLAALQTPGSPTLDYKRDIAPWLGPHAGVYLNSMDAAAPLTTMLQRGLLGESSATGAFPLGTGVADGAIVLDTSDAAKARSFLDTQASHAGARATSYRGFAYKLSAAGIAFGIVKRFAVIGSETGMHGVIDTALGGPALTRASGYAKLLAAAPAKALAHIYSNPAAAAAATAKPSSGSQEGLAGVLGLLSSEREANISLIASAGSLALDADTLTGSASGAEGLLSSDPRAAQALAELPGESWLAIGLSDVGAGLPADIQGLRALGSLAATPGGPTGVEAPVGSTLNIKSLLAGMLAPLNAMGAPTARAKRTFASWMGSGGIFVAGANLLELKAGVVIESKNPARSHAAVAALATQLRKAGARVEPTSIAGTDAAVAARLTGLPVVLDIANGQDSSGHTKFILGFGEPSVTAALNPASTLSSATSRSAAAATIGEGAQPSILTDFPTLLSLLEGVGLTEDPSVSKFVSYLRALTTLAGGGHSLGGEIQRYRLVTGLQSAPAG
ncbi:MAG TPA: DUF3352 domain-containing protein [Solirubrobacteraceae bacterium]|nr:DUF3352 domain-containing protein [Solirubrobacteraceae bacterium]